MNAGPGRIFGLGYRRRAASGPARYRGGRGAGSRSAAMAGARPAVTAALAITRLGILALIAPSPVPGLTPPM